MDNSSIDSLVNAAGIKPSPVRTLILRTLDEATSPLSAQDIEIALQSVDRSSISRSLAIFTSKGIVHAIDDGSGSVKYEICRSTDCHDNDLHPHFHCTGCGTTQCFGHLAVPPVDLPEGYRAVTTNYVIKGLCPQCARASDRH